MSTFIRSTRKLYYLDPYLSAIESNITKIGSDYLELDATVAYPEGGGQESDQGVLCLPDQTMIRFVHARKMYGHRANLADFPDIQVGGVIEHVIHPDDIARLARLHAGTQVNISIDKVRRAQLSLSHTASHLLYLGVAEVRPDAVNWTLGCHIRPDGARFDFGVDHRFTQDEVQAVEHIANEAVARNGAVVTYEHPDCPDARYWACEGHVIPCGGTHISTTAPIGHIAVRRKSMGAGKERISCQFADSKFDTSLFRETSPNDSVSGNGL
jgi:Ser-tRNA(Ala) deacylase AlaX